MMILNQVTRAFTARKRHTTTIFRRQKTASTTIAIDKEVEKKKKDDCIILNKNHAVDDYDIVSATSNSSTIDLTPCSTPCSSGRVIIKTSSSMSTKQRPDCVDSIMTISHIPTLVMALQSSNNDDENDNNADNITIIVDTIPPLRRSTSITDDENESDSDSDCDDSCIYAPPPVPFVGVPRNFSHTDALLQTTQDSNCNIHNNILLLNRPPTRIGDWDDHTIESNNNPEDDDIELLDTGTHKSNRSAAGVAAGTRPSSSMTMRILVDRRHKVRRHQARAVLSQSFLQLSPTSSHNNNDNTSKDTRTQLSTLINNDDEKQKQQYQQNQEEEQRQPRVVKWNMIR